MAETIETSDFTSAQQRALELRKSRRTTFGDKEILNTSIKDSPSSQNRPGATGQTDFQIVVSACLG